MYRPELPNVDWRNISSVCSLYNWRILNIWICKYALVYPSTFKIFWDWNWDLEGKQQSKFELDLLAEFKPGTQNNC